MDSIASPWETLPPDHWAYEEIRWLQVSGFLLALDPLQKPYSVGEISNAIALSKTPVNGLALRRFEYLKREFSDKGSGLPEWQFFTGCRFDIGVDADRSRDLREAGYGVINGGVGNDHAGAYTALRADLDLANDPYYEGKIWSDFAGLTEQAYLVINGVKRRWRLKLGRDHIMWGPGDDHLLLNDSQRGIDQISFNIRWDWGSFTALVGQVNDFSDTTGVRTSRFLSGHRLEFFPWTWLRFGLSETLLFTGNIRFGSMNPLLPYYGELVNENSEGNGLIGLDFIVNPLPDMELFGELLLDDIQLESKEPSDLEPTEWGWLIGGRWSGFDGLIGVGCSYSGITNRTYNAFDAKYRYLNYGLPIGSELGNDADCLRADFSIWPDPRIHLKAFWQYHRQGEGRVSAPFDTTYMDFTINQGYSESFPSGIVEKSNIIGMEFSVLAHRYLQLKGWIGHDWIKALAHDPDSQDDGFRGRVTLNLRFDHLINL